MINLDILKKIVINNHKIILIIFFIGIIISFLVFNLLGKVFESHFEIGLGKIEANKIVDSNQDLLNTPIPFILDAQRSLLNPENIPLEMLKSCGLTDSNSDRKKLVNNILVSRINSNQALLYRIRVNNPLFQKTCALYIANYQLDNFNGRLNQVIEELGPSNILNSPNIKIIKPLLIRSINHSDSFIFPNFYKILIGTELLMILLTFLFLYKRNINV